MADIHQAAELALVVTSLTKLMLTMLKIAPPGTRPPE